jgi:hypothetical protein
MASLYFLLTYFASYIHFTESVRSGRFPLIAAVAPPTPDSGPAGGFPLHAPMPDAGDVNDIFEKRANNEIQD